MDMVPFMVPVAFSEDKRTSAACPFLYGAVKADVAVSFLLGCLHANIRFNTTEPAQDLWSFKHI